MVVALCFPVSWLLRLPNINSPITDATKIKTIIRNGSIIITSKSNLYNHYYEKCLEQSKNPMDFSVFNLWFPNYIGARHIVDSLIDYYDNLFEIIIVEQINIELRVEKIINIL